MKRTGVLSVSTQNHLNRGRPAIPNGCGYQTYIRTDEHWLYLCVVLNLYSGLVVGWSMRPKQDLQLVLQAVRNGLMATTGLDVGHPLLGSR